MMKKMMNTLKRNLEFYNKKARFDYEIVDTYVAGIVLTGTEIKSVRAGKVSLVDTYCTIDNGEVWMINSYIAKYEHGTFYNHEERRSRKLLLNKQEINKLTSKIAVPGYTIVPLKMFINSKGLCKVEIALCIGKKEYDKRETIKRRDNKRELDKIMKTYGK